MFFQNFWSDIPLWTIHRDRKHRNKSGKGNGDEFRFNTFESWKGCPRGCRTGRSWAQQNELHYSTRYLRSILVNYISQAPLPAGFQVGSANRRSSRKLEGEKEKPEYFSPSHWVSGGTSSWNHISSVSPASAKWPNSRPFESYHCLGSTSPGGGGSFLLLLILWLSCHPLFGFSALPTPSL